MRRLMVAVVLTIVALSARLPVGAQSDAPPYLYYYSRLLGGIIIERADGTVDRQIKPISVSAMLAISAWGLKNY